MVHLRSMWRCTTQHRLDPFPARMTKESECDDEELTLKVAGCGLVKPCVWDVGEVGVPLLSTPCYDLMTGHTQQGK